jgi:3-hydroxyacyl-CoA dehydrogenase
MIADDYTQLFERFEKTADKKYRGFQAPDFCIRAVEAAVNLPFAEGLENEHSLFIELMEGIQSAAQRHYFFAERQVSKIPDIPADTPQIPIKNSAVIGAGTMGGGIAMNLVNAGIPVVLVETRQEYLDRGLSVIRKNYEASAAKGKMTQEEVERRMSLIRGTLSLEYVAAADLVIEAVFENMNLKKEVFRKLDRICKPGAILATNTSYLSVDEIAAETSRPEFVIGLHFFSPANVMRLLEIVRGAKTSKNVLATSIALGKIMKKIAVMVGVCYGFAANRMYMQRCRQDGKLILEGASLTQVDKVIYDFGFPLGPFALYDLIGMNVGWDKEHTSSSSIKEILCEKGRFGQKSGLGYYKYEPGGRTPIPDVVVEQIIIDFSRKKTIQRRQISDEEVLQRCIYAIINEGAKIIEEKIAVRPSDLDVIWVNGYGWPRYLGGPMFYADTVGLEMILDTIKTFQRRFGEDWKPAPLLERLVAEGKTFGDLN